ncbi:MAG TPA: aconitate hydratase [Erysipelotrichaceae bacterium]|nr:aconitate hydratase [Erysipelotrichaceae bacterium]
MKKTLTYKLFENHLRAGTLTPGQEIRLQVNQTLTQDTTGTMAYLQFLAMDVDKVKTDCSVAYIDHNMLQTGFENADDHAFIQSVAQKHGIIFSKPGAGICHQVHLERFAKPGTILLGSDSHTPTAGGLGAIAIGMGGLDVAVAMATGMTTIIMPKVYNIKLVNKPNAIINGKDIILKVLQTLSVTGGVGFVMEYTGDGLKYLSVTDRATICNMGAELGATTSIFPSDKNTYHYLSQQGRAEDYLELSADDEAEYDYTLTIDLSELKPMVAQPHMPDNVVEVKAVQGLKVDQVAVGSCTNSSYTDMMKVVSILKGKTIHPDVSLVISPGSANILRLLSENGGLSTLISAGARILESSCGPCIGMGQAPRSNGISVRSFNRNFKGRSGTANAQVYLVSPETAAASALMGVLTDPSDLNLSFDIQEPESFGKVDGYFIYPSDNPSSIEIALGPNIQPFPKANALVDTFTNNVVLITKDNVTTDDIVPSYAKLLPYRSNIPYLADYCFHGVDTEFVNRVKELKGGIIIGGENYGQGSSREHAALIPLYLGIKAVLAKSYARIHRSNLINVGILPLVIESTDFDLSDELVFSNLLEHVQKDENFTVFNKTKNKDIVVKLNATPREREILIKGGYLNYAKSLS